MFYQDLSPKTVSKPFSASFPVPDVFWSQRHSATHRPGIDTAQSWSVSFVDKDVLFYKWCRVNKNVFRNDVDEALAWLKMPSNHPITAAIKRRHA